jgi:hypothetical protein
MQYLVQGSGGPGFATPEETVDILEGAVLPAFDHLAALESDGRIRGGGLPLGERAFVFVLDASSNEEADRVLRDIPVWGVLEWSVTPMVSFAERAAKEREVVEQIRQAG